MASPLFEILGQALGGRNTDAIGDRLGVEPSHAASAMSMAIPVLIDALRRNAATPGGLWSLEKALGRDHDGSILDNLGGYLGGAPEPGRAEPGPTAPGGGGIGGDILGHILGRDRARVETGIGRASGIDVATVGKLLVMLAPVLLGALSRANRKTPPSTSIDDILGGATERMQQQAPGGGGALSEILGRDRDGSAFDDIAKMGASVLGGLLRGR